MNKLFAVIDAGCSETAVMAAQWNKSGDYVLEGFCISPSKGIRRGVVVDVSQATDSIAKAMEKLKEKTGKNIQDVYAAVSSTSISLVPSSGVVLLSQYGRDITQKDIKKCVEIGSTVKIPLEKEALHHMVKGFSVDDEDQIRNPLNLEGVKLSVDMNVVTVNSTVLRNLSKCISQAGYISAGFVFSGLVSSYRGITEEEKHSGIALVDICSDITEIMVFNKGILTGCKVVSTGADEILSADGVVIPQSMEKLASETVSLAGWDHVREVVVIGKGTLKDGLVDSMEQFFPCHVRAGTCVSKPFEELPQERFGYIASLGILDYLQEENHKKKQSGNLLKRGANRVLSFIDRYF